MIEQELLTADKANGIKVLGVSAVKGVLHVYINGKDITETLDFQTFKVTVEPKPAATPGA
jgi:hypothetical protein